MGIRIHKQLAWIYKGKLDLTKIENIKLNDFEKKFDLEKEDYLRMDFRYPGLKAANLSLTDCIKEVDNENEETELILFTPPVQVMDKTWGRYDDMIDYLENPSIRLKIKYIHRELTPYCNKSVVTKNLKPLSQIQKDRVRFFEGMDKERWNEVIRNEMIENGFDLDLPLAHQIHQTAPQIIEEFFKLLSDESYLVLRPAIVTHWG